MNASSMQKSKPVNCAEISKFKWKNGNLFALIAMGTEKLRSWWPCDQLPKDIVQAALSSKIRTIGSLNKCKKQLGLNRKSSQVQNETTNKQTNPAKVTNSSIKKSKLK